MRKSKSKGFRNLGGFPVPKFPKQVERICCHCRFYKLSAIADPFCGFWKEHFPNPRSWAWNPNYKKPGERTCDNWRKKNNNGVN
jgi:hypothetical protein